MFTFILSFVLGVFKNPVVIKFLLIISLIAAVIGGSWWAIHTIKTLETANAQILLQEQVKERDNALAAQKAEEDAFMNKVTAITDQLQTLNGKIAQASTTQQKEYNNLIISKIPVTKGNTIDTSAIETHTNVAMNQLFTDLQKMSEK